MLPSSAHTAWASSEATLSQARGVMEAFLRRRVFLGVCEYLGSPKKLQEKGLQKLGVHS